MTQRYGTHGRVLAVDLTDGSHEVIDVAEDVYRKFLGGYGLGAWLMWKHFPAGTDALAPEACFALVSGLLTGVRTPFSGRVQIVGKSALTGTWADSNSGGSVAVHLRAALEVQPGRRDLERRLAIVLLRDGDPEGTALAEEILADDPEDEELAELLLPGAAPPPESVFGPPPGLGPRGHDHGPAPETGGDEGGDGHAGHDHGSHGHD